MQGLILLKKAICLFLGAVIILSSFPAHAENSYIHIMPFPYSSYVLGEDIVVKGETDFDSVILGFYYPDENGYGGLAKLIINIFDYELREGYVIHTDTLSRLWPEGRWHITVQNGSVREDVYINLLEKPVYDKYLRIAEYDGDMLTAVKTYPARGAFFSDGCISFALENGMTLKLFFWNDSLSPSKGEKGKVYSALYRDGSLLTLSIYTADLSQSFPIKAVKDGKTVKFFYWSSSTQL